MKKKIVKKSYFFLVKCSLNCLQMPYSHEELVPKNFFFTSTFF